MHQNVLGAIFGERKIIITYIRVMKTFALLLISYKCSFYRLQGRFYPKGTKFTYKEKVKADPSEN